MASPLERGRDLLRELEAHEGQIPVREINDEEASYLASVVVEDIKSCLAHPDRMDGLVNTISRIVNKTNAAVRVRKLVDAFVNKYEPPLCQYWASVKKELFPC